MSLTNGVFSLSYLLFSVTGRSLVNCFSKAKIAHLIKFFTFFIALATAGSLLLSSITLLMVYLFLFSSTSALLGLIKYATLPAPMAKPHLPRTNAWIETAPLPRFYFDPFSRTFSFRNKNIENFSKAGKSLILTFNHIYFFDVFLALAICETIKLHNPVIVIDAKTTKLW
ncbi:hypothetical protein [Bartonella gliris]|uniref:hypothetical protein n=1 Tax=Bartonella gliris TaxID=3004109 RepID=UPI00295EB016|nr:hypothetical protein [Bartonella gliris]